MNNWWGFAYRADADLTINLIRTESTTEHTEQVGYIPALDRGWHLSPEADEDNHKGGFGSTPRRTGVWASELTRQGIAHGLRNRATFFTSVPHAWIKLTADDRWLMGSTVYGSGSHLLRVSVGVRGEGPQPGIVLAEVVTYKGAVVASVANPGTSVLETTVNPGNDAYYYARATLEGGAQLISAPIFVDR
jgi:hypothetical protein